MPYGPKRSFEPALNFHNDCFGSRIHTHFGIRELKFLSRSHFVCIQFFSIDAISRSFYMGHSLCCVIRALQAAKFYLRHCKQHNHLLNHAQLTDRPSACSRDLVFVGKLLKNSALLRRITGDEAPPIARDSHEVPRA